MRANGSLSLLAAAVLVVSSACQIENPEYSDLFDLVCETVSERFYDPDFGGADWPEIQNRCRRAAVTAADDEAFYRAVNCALFQLEVSHLGVIPSREDWSLIEPEVFSPGTVGLGVRKINGDLVITAVSPGLPAAAAGLRPGWFLTRIDGTPVGKIEAGRLCCLEPPFNPRSSVANEIAGRLYGEPGSEVAIRVVDEHGASREVTLTRVARGAPATYGPDLPGFHEEFESRRLEGGVRYIRFNTFMPGNAERFVTTLLEMGVAPGLVIDLRDNPGGHRLVCESLASWFITEPVLFAKLETREGPRNIVIEPAEAPFSGPLAIVVDVTSRSASEAFAAGLQAIGRASIVGERTPGSVGPADAIALPNGATLVCPTGLTTRPSGEVIEGRGVMPDITIAADRQSYLEGRDLALEAAVQLVKEQGGYR